jgi:hypothetical protein
MSGKGLSSKWDGPIFVPKRELKLRRYQEKIGGRNWFCARMLHRLVDE